MVKKIAAPILALAGLALVAAPAVEARSKLSGQEELGKLLEGRVAGEGKSCLSTFRTDNLRIIDKTALVYRDGATLWVNVPKNADTLDDDDIIVTRVFGSQLCKQDIVHTYERSGFFMNGIIALGDFVPYRRAES